MSLVHKRWAGIACNEANNTRGNTTCPPYYLLPPAKLPTQKMEN